MTAVGGDRGHASDELVMSNHNIQTFVENHSGEKWKSPLDSKWLKGLLKTYPMAENYLPS